jgi:hypothetical protein
MKPQVSAAEHYALPPIGDHFNMASTMPLRRSTGAASYRGMHQFYHSHRPRPLQAKATKRPGKEPRLPLKVGETILQSWSVASGRGHLECLALPK